MRRRGDRPVAPTLVNIMMTSDLKPYPAYKDAGIEWLGEVPTHWDLRRTKSLLVQRSQKGFPNEPLLAATQTKGVVRKERYENRTVLAMKDLELLKIVRVGDFVISLRSFQGGIEFAREQGIISPAYTILYPFESDHHAYLAKVFKSRPYIENLSLFVTGIRQGQNIDYERLARSYLPLPPFPEQNAIVRFLDHADRRIRRYIRAKQKLVALLEEQKQAIIHQAVTGQIDVRTGQPYPAYKVSGVEWLGEVPKHWEVLRLRDVGEAIIGLTYDPNDVVGEENGLLVLRASNISDGRIVDSDNVYVKCNVPNRLVLQMGDILLCSRSGSRALIGKNARINADFSGVTFGAFMTVFRSEKNDYLHHVFNSNLFEYQSGAFLTSTINQLTLSILYNIKIPLPQITEQKKITQYLCRATADLANSIQRVRDQIDLLHEYSTRLIADVVTGKLDVREAAAALPEVDPLAEDDLDGTIPDEENSNLDDLDAEESAEEYTIEKEMPL